MEKMTKSFWSKFPLFSILNAMQCNAMHYVNLVKPVDVLNVSRVLTKNNIAELFRLIL